MIPTVSAKKQLNGLVVCIAGILPMLAIATIGTSNLEGVIERATAHLATLTAVRVQENDGEGHWPRIVWKSKSLVENVTRIPTASDWFALNQNIQRQDACAARNLN